MEQAYRARVESELVRELEEESRRMREEMRKTLVTHEERCALECCVACLVCCVLWRVMCVRSIVSLCGVQQTC